MKNVMGIIYTGKGDARLRELTMTRAIAALPVAGRYRVIDFLMSSMVNGGIRNVGVIMQKNYHSLMDHLGSGKEWDLHGKNDGLHVLPPFLTRENVGLYNGTLDALRSNVTYLNRSRQEWVVLSGSDIIFNMDMDALVACAKESGADVTMVYTRNPDMRRDEYGTYLNVDESCMVTDLEVEPSHPSNEFAYMDVMVLRRELLLSLIERGASHGMHDFTSEVIQRMLRDGQLRVMGYEFTGPCWRIDSVQSYFRFNMDILDAKIRKELFNASRPIYTKVRDEMSARYATEPKGINSMVADGCIIEGMVENSVLSRGVRIATGAHVKNCVIMQDAQVHADAYIENCILDKQSVIKRNAKLIGPEAYPIVIAKNVVI